MRFFFNFILTVQILQIVSTNEIFTQKKEQPTLKKAVIPLWGKIKDSSITKFK